MLRRIVVVAALAMCVLPVSGCGKNAGAYGCPPPIYYVSKVYFPRPVDDTFVVGAELGQGDVESCDGEGSDDYPTGNTAVYQVPGVRPENGFAATLDGRRYFFTLTVGTQGKACQRQGVICD